MTTKSSCMDIKVDHNTAVVFDLDDTLYNEIAYLKSAYRELAKRIDPENWRILYSRMFSLYRNQTDVFEFLKDSYGSKKDQLIKIYRAHEPEITLFDGVEALFSDIKEKGGSIGLITDGRALTQRNKIRALGISDYLDELVISEEIGSEKPDPQNYNTIVERFDVGNYIYIGDNLKKDLQHLLDILILGLNLHQL